MAHMAYLSSKQVLKTSQLFALILFYGGFLAIYESTSRTIFCELVPPGQEAEFFGIYEISDKGSSWIGPIIGTILYEM